MSWTCPRCQQPVFFGEAQTEEGEKIGRVRPAGFPEDTRSGPRGKSELPGQELAPLLPEITMGGRIATGHAMGLSSDPGVRVNIGGVGSYLYNSPTPCAPLSPSSFSPPRPSIGFPQGKKTEKVMSLGRNWHRPCLRCQRCRKTLTAGSHAEVNREGMVVLLGGGRLKMGRQPSSDGFLSLCPSMMAFPIATSPAMATCLAPKVGSPTPDMWVWGNLLTTSQVVKHASGPSQFPPALSPAPPATPKAHGDKALSLRCEHW
ncbi:cysteine-rich protein 3 isoform X5 [Manis pentadactyla]|uniref:cysteine-rich protein 3 isoform X5 n=1 Tax=Manis pentadactyla TaxID=143292 RepID=UPI00255C6F6C|nr:cysteine-rich protein 3 isoform X5 [Manis pentadactyla]